MIARAGYYIWLAEISGAGSDLSKRVFEAFDGDMQSAYEADAEAYTSLGFTVEEAQLLSDKDFTRTNMILDYCAENKVGLLLMGSEYYPEKLYGICDPPPVLYYKGRIEKLRNSAAVTAIGSRKCSESAHDAAYTLCYKLACNGVSLVSGIAEGIDSACIRGTLDGGGFAIGVMGSGINMLYPYENSALYMRMFRSGLVITEFSPFTEPLSVNFPIRNRIMAALGDAVLVVEARENSGALITADLASGFGKRIFAVPGSTTNPLCRGSNELLKRGATPVTEADDIINEFRYAYPTLVSVASDRKARLTRSGYVSKRKRRRSLKTEDPTPPAPQEMQQETFDTEPEMPPAAEPDLSMLSETEKQIYHFLKEANATADAVGAKLELAQNKVLASLTMLEIYGLVQSLPGGMYKAV